MKRIEEIRAFMGNMGIPGRDLWDLPSSTMTFPDGADYRIEVAGVERASTMEAMIKEANKRGVIVHRAIATVGGSTYCDFQELKAMAQMAFEEKIEVIMTVVIGDVLHICIINFQNVFCCVIRLICPDNLE